MPDDKIFTIPSSGPEKNHLIAIMKCCREWPIVMGAPMGKCGYCGKIPKEY